jgi:hypothetical protein
LGSTNVWYSFASILVSSIWVSEQIKIMVYGDRYLRILSKTERTKVNNIVPIRYPITFFTIGTLSPSPPYPRMSNIPSVR